MRKPALASMLLLLGLPALADAQVKKPTPYIRTR
jgi:hypothetical protein